MNKKMLKKHFLCLLDFSIKNVTRLLIVILIITQIFIWNYDITISIIVLRIILFCLTLKILGLLSLYWINPPTSAFMLQTANSYFHQEKNTNIHYIWVKYEQISPFISLAVIVAEDSSFPQHSGFNWSEIIQAWKANRDSSSSSLRGGSSISQQTIKNLFLCPQKSYFRKFLEAYLTIIVEAILSKKRILEIYLNIVQFSPNIFGVEAASLYFFQKKSQQITAEEASLLAAVLPNPYIYSVQKPSQYVIQKQKNILNKMNRYNQQGKLI